MRKRDGHFVNFCTLTPFFRTLQILSVHPFEKVTLNELLTETDHRTFINSDPNQLNLF